MADDEPTPALDPDAGPEAAFALVSNEIRTQVIRVLGEDHPERLSFSELRDRTEKDIPSSQFNYHLQQLLGTFVDRREEGYRLSREGLGLYRSIVAGSFTRRASIESFDAGFDCYFCDGTVEASYGDARITIQCADCEHSYHFGRAPPSIADLEDERALLECVHQFSRHNLLSFTRGVCPRCATPVHVEWIPVEASPFDDLADIDLFARVGCDNCGAANYMTTGIVLLRDPRLIAFCYDHGIDVTETPFWELEFAMTDRCTTVRSADPYEVEFALTLDDETLTIVLDEELDAIERERH